MRTAIVIHGNLRTFLMPLRGQHTRVCDQFVRDVVSPNNADVFAFTDTSDFYYEGTQYYSSDRKVEILNNNAFRLAEKVDFMDPPHARRIIEGQLSSIIPGLKALEIEDPFDVAADPKFQALKDTPHRGCTPSLLVHQWRKARLAYTLMEASGEYDRIIKWRFDLCTPGSPLSMTAFDFESADIYVPGLHRPIIYDWNAFGTRQAMGLYMTLYDRLADLAETKDKVFMGDCRRCGRRVYHGRKDESRSCCNEALAHYEITIASEYHLLKFLEEKGMRVKQSGYAGCPYRYRDVSDNTPIDEVMRRLGAKDITLVNYTGSKDVGISRY